MHPHQLPEIDPLKPWIILYGIDADGRTRAARFGPLEAELVKKAAETMKLNYIPANTDELKHIAIHLKYGTIYQRGLSFMPVVKKRIYDDLVLAVGIDVTALMPPGHRKIITNGPPRVHRDKSDARIAKRKSSSQKPTLPTSWEKIKVGDLVIAQANPQDGWWEAIVIGINGEDIVIKWRDFGKFRELRRKRISVALLKPQ